jgi:hypothetical protein
MKITIGEIHEIHGIRAGTLIGILSIVSTSHFYRYGGFLLETNGENTNGKAHENHRW